MKTKLFLWAILAIPISFSACNKEEDSLLTYQEEVVPEEESTGQEVDILANTESSLVALLRSLELSTKALPAYVNEITLSPTGAINPNGETRTVIAKGTFTSTIEIKADDLGSGKALATGKIKGNGTMGSVNLTIPPYDAPAHTANRVIGFFYLGSTNQWELFHFETQSPKQNVTPFTIIASPAGSYEANGKSYSFSLYSNHTWTAVVIGGTQFIKAVNTPAGNAGYSNFTFTTHSYNSIDGTATIMFISNQTGEIRTVILNFKKSAFYVTQVGGYHLTTWDNPPVPGLALIGITWTLNRNVRISLESDPTGIVYNVQNNTWSSAANDFPRTFSGVIWVHPNKKGVFSLRFTPIHHMGGPTGEAPIIKTVTFLGI